MKITVNIVNAFSLNSGGGNKAGVVLNADHLSVAQKLAVAQQTGLSETAFISKSAIADFKLDFFTPSRQIAHCGHATIASFAFLKQLGFIGDQNQATKETIDGIRQISFREDEVYMEQKAPIFTSPGENQRALIFQSLGLPASHGYLPHFVNTGNTFLILQVNNRKDLQGLNPDLEKIKEISITHALVGYYIFCASSNGFDAEARMFAPAYGIKEEAATGMAAGPLAAYLFKIGMRKLNFTISQGALMNPCSPSLIKVHLMEEDGKIQALFAGGAAMLSDTKEVEI